MLLLVLSVARGHLTVAACHSELDWLEISERLQHTQNALAPKFLVLL